tara:strand:+ start:2786 stop:2986 length:201 start_codon:yes stop_codon:yes gene_type:complete
MIIVQESKQGSPLCSISINMHTLFNAPFEDYFLDEMDWTEYQESKCNQFMNLIQGGLLVKLHFQIL